jgi:hypothetical protein
VGISVVALRWQGPTVQNFGSQGTLVDAGGAVVQGWTVNDLRPSRDVIPYPVQGRLWEASATDTAIKGSVTPVIADMNARAGNGDSYQVIWNVPLAQGVNPSTLSEGASTSGKLYFDVTGAEPGSVIITDDAVQDLHLGQVEPAGRREDPDRRCGAVARPPRRAVWFTSTSRCKPKCVAVNVSTCDRGCRHRSADVAADSLSALIAVSVDEHAPRPDQTVNRHR